MFTAGTASEIEKSSVSLLGLLLVKKGLRSAEREGGHTGGGPCW